LSKRTLSTKSCCMGSEAFWATMTEAPKLRRKEALNTADLEADKRGNRRRVHVAIAEDDVESHKNQDKEKWPQLRNSRP